MAAIKDLLLIVDEDGDSLSALRAAAEHLQLDRVEVDRPGALPAILSIRTPTIAVLAVDGANSDPIKSLASLASARCYPQVVLVGSPGTRVLPSVRRAAERRGFRVIGELSTPLERQTVEQLLMSQTGAGTHFERSEIATAIAQYEFALVYQPVLTLGSEALTVSGAEALVRWRHPERGQLLPYQFMQAVESCDLMPPLTDFVLTEAIRQAGHWSARGLNLELVINLCPSLVKDHEFPDRLDRILKEHGVRPDRLTLDVADTAVLRHSELMLDVFTRLRNMGIGLAIDNFGTGSSSLLDLYQLPFSEVKIDGELLRSATTERDAEIIVRALAKLARDLKIRIGAKQVDKIDVFWLVLAAHFDYAQGRLLCGPVTANLIEQLAIERTVAVPQPIREAAGISEDAINRSSILKWPAMHTLLNAGSPELASPGH